MAGEVLSDLDDVVAACLEQSANGLTLVGADLEHQPSAGHQMGGRAADEVADVVEPVDPAEQCRGGAPTRRTASSSSGSNRRRRTGGLATITSKRTSPGSASNHDPCADSHVARRSPDTGEVRACDGERIDVVVGDPHRRSRRTAARPPATVRSRPSRCRDRRRVTRWAARRRGQLDRVSGHQLGLGSRDQHPAVDGEIEPCGTPTARARTATAHRSR